MKEKLLSSKLSKMKTLEVQATILGPMLWNLLYDFKIEPPRGVRFIGFGGDLAMVTTAKTEETLMTHANMALVRVAIWIENRHRENQRR